VKKKRIWSVMAKSEQPQTGDRTVGLTQTLSGRSLPAVSQAQICAAGMHKHRETLPVLATT
jgi:hypothetical protein